ncbi:MAG: hypothetical protein WBP41_17730 [Saprospiraceae bacterium]
MKQYDSIRKKLLDYTVEVDKNKLWEKTSFAIPQKRKRRTLPFILLAGAFLLGAGYYNYALHQTTNITLTTKETTSATQPLTTTPFVNSENHDPASIQDDGRYSSVHHPDLQNSDDKKDPAPGFTYASKHHLGSPSERNEIHDDILEAFKSSPNEITPQTDDLISGLLPPYTNQTYKDRTSTIEDNATLVSLNSSVIPISLPDIQTRDENLQTRFSNASDQLLTLPIHYVTQAQENKFEYPHSITPAKNKKKFSISIMQAIGVSDVHIITSNPELYPVRDKWKNNVQSLEAISTHLEGSIHIAHGIQLGVGFQFNRLTSLLDYTRITTERITGEGTTSIVVDEQGHEQSITGTQGITRETHIHSKRYTYHKRVDIESSLRFRLYHHKGIRINGWLKGGINLFYSAKGAAFDTNDSVFSFTASDNPYTLSSPFTFGAGLEAEYRLNKHLKLMSRLSYDQFSFNHKLFDDQLLFKYSIYSLGLGIGYVF